MVAQQENLRVPQTLVPRCPKCGAPMAMNLRSDNTFVQDEGWHAAHARYEKFMRRNSAGQVLHLELGVGFNTPVIIKYPFWHMTVQNPKAIYACINYGQAGAPVEISEQAICINADIGEVLKLL